jgi:tRNA (guanine-N7-)-methyltransferase
MAERRQIFGRRLGPRLRPGRRHLLEQRLPRLRLQLPEAGRIETDRLFPGGPRPLWLEIGFGGGEHLVEQAAAHPEVGCIGCEPYLSGVARLLALAEQRGLENIRLVVDDARFLLRALPDGCLQRVFALFPDPWPKKRHHKRRLIQPVTAAEIARVLAVGGELRLATDDPEYARAMLAACLGEPRLGWLARRPTDWRERLPDGVETRYEAKALAAGRRCLYLRFVRRPAEDHGEFLQEA